MEEKITWVEAFASIDWDAPHWKARREYFEHLKIKRQERYNGENKDN
jgi:hypothetical protein